MSLFKKRINYKPFEYPEVMKFIDAINKSFWVHSEVDFTADVQDFHSNLTEVEKEVVKRSILSIAQIEVSVKSFWGDLYKHFPKPEMNGLGSTLAENEFRHSEAYGRLLEVLGYNKEFEKALQENPIFAKRVQIISDGLNTDNIINKLLMFTIIVENTSLFSQFANILSFTRFKGYMKNVSNIIAWTSTDELIHAEAGIFLLNKIKEEGHEMPTQEYVESFVRTAIKLEEDLINWIFEKGELEFYSKDDLLNFMKYRIDDALVKLGYFKVFNITSQNYQPMSWFEEEIFTNSLDDFFAKRPVDYTKHDKPITKDDLF